MTRQELVVRMLQKVLSRKKKLGRPMAYARAAALGGLNEREMRQTMGFTRMARQRSAALLNRGAQSDTHNVPGWLRWRVTPPYKFTARDSDRILRQLGNRLN